MGTTANRLYPYPGASDNVYPYEDIEALADAVDVDVAAMMAAWTAYTPTFTADSGSPAIGSTGVIGGRYLKIGRTVHYRGRVRFGGTGISFGTGAMYVSLPHAASANAVGAITMPDVGAAYIRDASAPVNFAASCMISPDLNAGRLAFYQNAAAVTGTSPVTFATDDHISWGITYEAAA
jgi:hypothetical protein